MINQGYPPSNDRPSNTSQPHYSQPSSNYQDQPSQYPQQPQNNQHYKQQRSNENLNNIFTSINMERMFAMMLEDNQRRDEMTANLIQSLTTNMRVPP